MATNSRLPQLKLYKKFRPYQREAIKLVRNYRRKHLSGETSGCALICHPTGTGKTAVIAGVAQASPEIGAVLVLCTRQAIRDQLGRELSGNLFLNEEKFGTEPAQLPKKPVLAIKSAEELDKSCRSLQRSTLTGVSNEIAEQVLEQVPASSTQKPLKLAKNDPVVIIMTVQLLASLKRTDASSYKDLTQFVDMIVFDEGHYEPAKTWSKAIRELQKPCALMSATPYRNDLKPFAIRNENVHILRYVEAVEGHFVRNVAPIQRPRINGAAEFSEDILNFVEDRHGTDRSQWPRIIIHCDTAAKIVALTKAFLAAGLDVIGIHDTFRPDEAEPWRHRSVPNPQNTDAKIWIHQYKLMEGIDDYRFQILAFFDPMSNVRSLVQQVGRIIRTGPTFDDEEAVILDHFGGRIIKDWSLFRDYDASLTVDMLTLSVTKFYLNLMRKNHPDVDYIANRFRRKLDLNKVDNPLDEFLFDRRATLRKPTDVSSIGPYTTKCIEDLEARDFEVVKVFESPSTSVIVYAYAASPEFLNNSYFAEIRHGARIVIFLPEDKLVAFSDTNSNSISLSDSNLFERFDRSRLQRLISPGALGRLSSVSSQNTSLGNRVVRRRSYSAPSIKEIPVGLDEHGHVVSSVSGFNGDRQRFHDDSGFAHDEADFDNLSDFEHFVVGEKSELIRRYVGLSTGRVSESGDKLRPAAMVKWIKSLAQQFNDGADTKEVYSRFAEEIVDPIHDGAAKNILVDLFDAMDVYRRRKDDENLLSEDLCVDTRDKQKLASGDWVSYCDLEFNGVTFTVKISFSVSGQRYRIDSTSLDEAYYAPDALSDVPICRFLNDRQAFNIIPEHEGSIYVHGRFFRPSLNFGAGFQAESFQVGQCLYPSDTFKNVSSEKGSLVVRSDGSHAKKNGDQFDPSSLFGMIDGWKEGFDTDNLQLDKNWVETYNSQSLSFEPTMVICDDMNAESGDFIIVDEKRWRVAYVHAKASKNFAPRSASTIQEVCAQAQKNLWPFAMFSLLDPPNLQRWREKNHKFKGSGNVMLEMKDRIRKPLGLDGDQAWARLRKLLLHPQTDREVWLVLGNMMSASELELGLQKTPPTSECVQTQHLLDTTIGAAGQLNAKLRVFCAP